MLWIAKPDLATQAKREYHSRFLNIANPWDDQRLRTWNGYSRKFFFDQDNRPVSASNPDARSVEMIPLAIYGLDHPKIPALLIDFRSSLNPKNARCHGASSTIWRKYLLALELRQPAILPAAMFTIFHRTPRCGFEPADAAAQLFRTKVIAFVHLSIPSCALRLNGGYKTFRSTRSITMTKLKWRWPGNNTTRS
jgi:hypothetical protein